MIKRALPEDRFARNVFTLVFGTAVGQLIAIAGTPVLTRLFSPTQFGMLAVFSSLLSIVSVIGGLRYELAIPLPRSDRAASSVLALALACVAGISLLAAAVIIWQGDRFAVLLGTPDLAAFFWLLPIAIALSGAYQAFSYWATRVGAFREISATKVQQGLAGMLVQIGSGLAHSSTLGLLAGSVMGQSVGLLRLVRVFKGPKLAWRLRSILATGRRFSDFPTFTSLAALTNSAGHSLPPLVLASFFSPSVAGLYLLAQRLGSQPLTLIGRSVAQVFLSGAATARRVGRLGELTASSFHSLLVVGVLPISLLSYVGPVAFALVFGEKWRDAGTYLQLLSPWLIAQFLVSPLGTLFVIVERQKLGMHLQILLLMVRIGSLLLGALYADVFLALALFGISSALIFVLFGGVAFHLAGADLRLVGRMLCKELMITFSVLLAIFATTFLGGIAGLSEVSLDYIEVFLVMAASSFAMWRVRNEFWIRRAEKKGALSEAN